MFVLLQEILLKSLSHAMAGYRVFWGGGLFAAGCSAVCGCCWPGWLKSPWAVAWTPDGLIHMGFPMSFSELGSETEASGRGAEQHGESVAYPVPAVFCRPRTKNWRS